MSRTGSKSVATSLAHAASIALFVGLSSSEPADAQVDFLRGDANSDGAVSAADAQFIFSFLYRQGALPECLKAADVDDDGRVDFSDAFVILSHSVFLQGSPCDPFPSVGADTTDDDLLCEAYGGGEALVDLGAEIAVLEASADDAGQVVIRVAVTNPTEIAGYSGVISVEGDVLADGQVVATKDLSGTYVNGFQRARVSEGKLHFGFIGTVERDEWIPPGAAQPVLELTACLAAETQEGDYELPIEAGELIDTGGKAIRPTLGGSSLVVSEDFTEAVVCDSELVESFDGKICAEPPTPPPEPEPEPPVVEEPRVAFVRGDANADGVVSISDAVMIWLGVFQADGQPVCPDAVDADDDGVVSVTDSLFVTNYLFIGAQPPPAPYPEVGLDPTADVLPCDGYDIVEPEQSADVVELGEPALGAESRVEIPVFLTTVQEVDALQLVVNYDPAVFIPCDGAQCLVFDGSFYENQDLTRGIQRMGFRQGPEVLREIFTVVFFPHVNEGGGMQTVPIPPGKRRLVFKLRGTIGGALRPGDFLLELTNGPDEQGVGTARMRNELSCRGKSRLPIIRPPDPKVDDGIVFLRGDANADVRVDTADAVFVLNYLFLNGPEPRCRDSADTDDSGTLDLSDGVSLLNFLFLGGSVPPAPGASRCGPDPTADAVTCVSVDCP